MFGERDSFSGLGKVERRLGCRQYHEKEQCIVKLMALEVFGEGVNVA